MAMVNVVVESGPACIAQIAAAARRCAAARPLNAPSHGASLIHPVAQSVAVVRTTTKGCSSIAQSEIPNDRSKLTLAVSPTAI